MATKTIKASGGDYTTLTAWLASLPATLTEPEIALVDAFDLVDTVLISKTTSAANYIEIKADAGLATNGVFGTTKARIRNGSAATTAPVRIGSGHVRIRGLQIQQERAAGTGGLGPIQFTGSVSGSDVQITECLLVDAQSTSTTYSITATSANLNLTLQNVICIGAVRSIDTRGSASAKIYNSIFWRTAAQLGLVCGTEATIRNTYSGASVSGADCFWTGGSPVGSYNASSDTTAVTKFATGSVNSVAGSAAFMSVTAGSENFNHASGSTALINAGTTIGTVTADILGTTRPQGAAYDIGAFEYVSAGGTNGTASGVVVSASSSLVTGSASGQINASAAGAIVAATSSIVTGSAAGQSNGTAVAAVVSASASLLPGVATAGGSGTANGVVMGSTLSILPGSAAGQISAAAAGVILAATASLLSGSATGAISATAAGATMSVTSSLLPGSASASGVGTLLLVI